MLMLESVCTDCVRRSVPVGTITVVKEDDDGGEVDTVMDGTLLQVERTDGS